jgi:hypothetical protein
MITLVIRFGDLDDDEFGETETVNFDTLAEADAFMAGVEMSNGWDQYTLWEDGREGRR